MEKRDKRREEKRNIIIKAAKDVFLRKGLFNVIMDDIATEVGLTRRTLYHYFKTKEELAYETAIILLSEWNDYCLEVYKRLNGTGLERFKNFFDCLIDHMALQPKIIKYLVEFDFYFSDDRREKPSTDSINRFSVIVLRSDDLIKRLMERGIKDGSMRKDIDVKLMTATISNVLWSFGQNIVIRGEKIEIESGIKNIELIRNQVSLYVMVLKSKGKYIDKI
ncbi:TetR/AcrR family transcriptional regulator [Clostridiaceae bacterium M8S5]|nr:TetR/AcrR family transcriptional regulator [Clostridiaceae bacterium M8S5]